MAKIKKNYYSKFVILVCIEQHEDLLPPAYQVIMDNVKIKWQQNHDPSMDPNRFSIIFVSQNDIDAIGTPEHKKKFSALNDIDDKSRIYIIGHSAKGSDNIWSNPIERLDQQGKSTVEEFSYRDLALLITENISMKNSPVLMPRIFSENGWQQESVHSLGRRLKICLTPCNSGNDRLLRDGTTQKSFGHKFFNYLLNGLPDRWLKCDVVATKGYVFPMPTNPNMLDLFKILSLAYSPTTTATRGFHKRYGLVEGNLLSTLFPRHKATNIDCKILFSIDPLTTFEQMENGKINFLTLAGPELQSRLPNQEIAEFIRDECLRIAADEQGSSDDIRNRAIFIVKGIVTGEMPDKQVRTSYEHLLKSIDHELRSPPRIK